MYDTIIIGAGAAGLTAAIFSLRKQLKTLILSIDAGGQANKATNIQNYPGYKTISGYELLQKFNEQALSLGAEIITAKVTKIKKSGKEFKVLTSNKREYETRTIILAFGRVPAMLNLPNEQKYLGKGISTCTICDAPLFYRKTVAVIGGGNSAIQSALELSAIAKKVYLIHRRGEYRADEILQKELCSKPNIEQIKDQIPIEIKGDQLLRSITLKDLKTKKKQEIKLDGIFLELGTTVDTLFLKGLVKLNKNNEIIINSICQTSQKGIFAAGDVTSLPYKQVIISAGEGAKAALSAYNYLNNRKVSLDWK